MYAYHFHQKLTSCNHSSVKRMVMSYNMECLRSWLSVALQMHQSVFFSLKIHILFLAGIHIAWRLQ